MRTDLLTLVFVVVPLFGCGRGALEGPPEPLARVEAPAAVAPSPQRLLLRATFEWSEGYRFADQARLTRGPVQRCTPQEVRDARGTLVEGEAARVDLQAGLGRFLSLTAEGGSVCTLPDPVGSLQDIDPARCSEWRPLAFLHVNTPAPESAAGTGLVVRTERDGDVRLFVVDSGRSEGADYVLLEQESR